VSETGVQRCKGWAPVTYYICVTTTGLPAHTGTHIRRRRDTHTRGNTFARMHTRNTVHYHDQILSAIEMGRCCPCKPRNTGTTGIAAKIPSVSAYMYANLRGSYVCKYIPPYIMNPGVQLSTPT